MSDSTSTNLITAREAEAYIPPLRMFAGNYRLKEKLLAWRERPLEYDANLLVEGDPGTGKTTILIAYLREQFRNPMFYMEDFAKERRAALDRGETVLTLDVARAWQSEGKYRFVQIDGASVKKEDLLGKMDEVMDSAFMVWEDRYATHKVCLLDEAGELFFNGLDEVLRPMLTIMDPEN